MNIPLGRRPFLKRVSAAAGMAACSAVGAPALLADPSPNSRIAFAVIGCGGRSAAHLPVAASERLVAVADPDEPRMASALAGLSGAAPAQQLGKVDVGKVQKFYDYRRMFDAIHKQIDAVFVVTADHHHAPASMMAIKLGKHVFCEKPLSHDVFEARALGEAARKHRVVTQMGNQGHAFESVRRLAEYLQAGAIGPVRETHSWQCR